MTDEQPDKATIDEVFTTLTRSLTVLSKDFRAALNVLEELLLSGQHEGRCTNLDAPEERCELHSENYERRERQAREFLALHRQ